MRRVLAGCALALAVAWPGAARAAVDRPSAWEVLESRVVAAVAAANPVDATQFGLHRYDTRLPDYSSTGVRRTVQRLQGLLREVRAFPTAKLTRETLLDRSLLVRELESRIRYRDVERLWQKSPYFYAGILSSGIQYLVINHHASADTLAAALSARLEGFPRLLEQATANIHQPPRLLCQACAQTLHVMPEMYRSALPAACKGASPGSLRRLDAAIATAADGISAYLEGLGELEEEHGTDDYPLGQKHYDWRLRQVEGLDLTGEQLARQGDAWLADVEADIAKLTDARKAAGIADAPVGPTPQDFSREQILESFVASIDSAKRYVRERDLVTIPANLGPLVPTPTPPDMRPIVPGMAMLPPATFDTSTAGTYFLGGAFPDSLTASNRDRFYERMARHEMLGGSVHEGIPGHHLQLSIAKGRNSFTRRFVNSTTMVEGWAFYCEELMARAGFYGPDSLVYLQRVLPGIRFRATRVVIDARVHTGKMTYEQAVRFMRDHNPQMDSARASGEVLRYVTEPTQAMSYLVGKSLIVGLRAEVERREGAKFHLKSFHDRFLGYGSIPVPWIARDWIGSVPAIGRYRLARMTP